MHRTGDRGVRFGFEQEDVYSYGVFLFTLFTGRKLLILRGLQGKRSSLIGFPEEGLIKLSEAALMCVDPQLLARPEMRFVESMFSDVAVHEVPTCPTLTRRHSI
ncbi:hypothetical protein Bca52824_022618 [Brassica carinata]|uniref:Protein kinase domain-containing protein n=1 Tax=Brassica carinata TaxID=52824 RepID=A0A8X7VH09_BRACI|nr:hypothetical protein Bca52824_022618 [Brassica carinata]